MNDPTDPADDSTSWTPGPESSESPGPGDQVPAPVVGAPYAEDLPTRSPLDPARPWLEAGRSWDARADQLRVYLDQRRGRPRRRWETRDRGLADLEARAAACRTHGRFLDRFTAAGWVVWHDRVQAGTRNVVDHVLIGPAGVALIQTQPGLDYIQPPIGRSPGQRTQSTLKANRTLLHDTIGPGVVDAVAVAMPGWTIRVHWVQVLHDPTIRLWFTDVLRPEQITPWLAELGSPFGPTHVLDIAATLESVIPPAPLMG